MPITGLDILQSAEKYKGVPYFEGNPQGVPPAAKGMDCSGLVQRAMSDLGVKISRTTSSQLADAVAQHKVIGTNLAQAQQGDILHYTGHCEIWIGNNNVFSEAVPGTVADIRPRTPWPIIGIVRYADGGAGPVGGTVVNAPSTLETPDQMIDGLPVIFDPVKPILHTIIGFTTFVGDISNFIVAATQPNFWERVATAFLGIVLLGLGIYGMIHQKKVITVTTDMMKKGAQIASAS